MPAATVQMLYRTSHADGCVFVSHPLIGATGYTGSRSAGLVIKEAADRVGKPIYLELSSINPVYVLPGALAERASEIAAEYVTSALMGAGQFCTNPGLVVVVAGEESEAFIDEIRAKFAAASPGTLLGTAVLSSLDEAVTALRADGAEVLTGGERVDGDACRYTNTLLRASGAAFLGNPAGFQREAFGNAGLVVVAETEAALVDITAAFEGNLTGALYTHSGGDDDALHDAIVRPLRRRVGRLLNDKMPTGVAVCGAMNHGGPFLATGHPGFTAVGIPASLRRFAMLESWDNVREARLPAVLRDRNPDGAVWRRIDGEWTRSDVSA